MTDFERDRVMVVFVKTLVVLVTIGVVVGLVLDMRQYMKNEKACANRTCERGVLRYVESECVCVEAAR